MALGLGAARRHAARRWTRSPDRSSPSPWCSARCSCLPAFIAGITGQFFRQFALTIAASTVISAFNSLTLSPALCAILLKPHSHDETPARGSSEGRGGPADRLDRHAGSGPCRWLRPSRLRRAATAKRQPGPRQFPGALGCPAVCLVLGSVAGWFAAGAVNRGPGDAVQWFQLGLRPDDRRLWPHRGPASADQRHRAHGLRRPDGAYRIWGSRSCRSGSSPNRTKATWSSTPSCRMAPAWSGPTPWSSA